MIIPNLAQLPPTYARRYLEARGWAPIDEEPERYVLLGRRVGRQDYEAFVPMRQTLRDYERRLVELLTLLQDVEKRSMAAIAEDIFSAPFDVVRLGAEHAEFSSGSVTLDAGVALVNSAKEMLLAASCATVQHRPYFPTNRPAQATDLMRRARLGQTERGSYIVKVFIPMPSAESSPLFAEVVEEPFERKATRTLMRAVRAVVDAAKESEIAGTVRPFLSKVKSGVTANLCDALADLSNVRADALSLDIGWSAMIPSPRNQSAILIEPRVTDILREAGRFLKGAPEVKRQTLITGVVTDFHHEDEPEGRVIVSSVIDDKKRRIIIKLSREDYRQAWHAHDNRLPVICRGELIQHGRTFELIEPRDFTVVTQLTLRGEQHE